MSRTAKDKKHGASGRAANHAFEREADGEDFLIVGSGASAGGNKALKKFFQAVPKDGGMAYVVILRLSPEPDGKLAEVLRTSAQIPVVKQADSSDRDTCHAVRRIGLLLEYFPKGVKNLLCQR